MVKRPDSVLVVPQPWAWRCSPPRPPDLADRPQRGVCQPGLARADHIVKIACRRAACRLRRAVPAAGRRVYWLALVAFRNCPASARPLNTQAARHAPITAMTSFPLARPASR